MAKQYTLQTRTIQAAPRSKRLRELGGNGVTHIFAGIGAIGSDNLGIDDIRDLRTILENKAAKVHTHIVADVTGLQEVLDKKFDNENIITAASETPESDKNAYSASRSKAEDEKRLRKDVNDTAKGHITFKQGITSTQVKSDSYSGSGFTGTGYALQELDDGTTALEVDHLTVRRSAQFYELIIQQLKHQGGIVFYTAAAIECTSVTSDPNGYTCFFDNKQGTQPNEFCVGDQARCQRFYGNLKYYWRLVIAIGEDYIKLSKTDCDAGSGVPEAGDMIVQLGHRSDTSRQSAKITNVVGKEAPRDEFYEGINSYNLNGCLVTVVGMKDGKMGVYTDNGRFSGDVIIGANSAGLGNLSEWASAAKDIQDSQAAAALAQRQNAELNNYIQKLETTVTADIAAANAKLDGVIEYYRESYNPTTTTFPQSAWSPADYHTHNGDTFINTITGNSWKWKIQNNAWGWIEITDTYEKSILAKINIAQETASSKIRLFVSEPIPPYSENDLYSNNGELLKCIISRESGLFSAADWNAATKYTDDQRAIAAEQAAKTYALAQANLATTTSKAYADGVVSSEEARAIADATKKANDAKDAAIAAAASDATAKSNAAKGAAEKYALAKANLAEVTAKAYADGVVDAEEARAIADAQTKAAAAQQAAIAASATLTQGSKMLYRDPEFREGMNGVLVYNNLENGTVTIERIAKPTDCPTTSTHCIEIKTTGVAEPALGGFFQPVNSRANAVFIQKIVAKIPQGYNLALSANALGDGSSDMLLTSKEGTGKYETYIRKTECGAIGSFSNGGCFYLTGTAPVTWYVASCTAYDITDTEKYDQAIAQSISDSAKNLGFTTIENGLIQSNLIKLQRVGGQETAGISGIDKNSQGQTLPAFWAGGTYAQALNRQANVDIYHNGKSKLGRLFVNEDGSTVYKDISNVDRIYITPERISALSDLTGSSTAETGVNTSSYGKTIILNTFNTNVLLGSIFVSKNSSDLIIKNIAISASIINNIPAGSAEANVMLYIQRDGAIFAWLDNVGVSYYAREESALSPSESKTIDTSLKVAAGTYQLYAEVTLSSTSDMIDASCYVSTGRLAWQYIANISKSELGQNGMLSFRDINNYIYAAIENNLLNFVIKTKGKWDTPGVLAAYTVNNDGTITRRWGGMISNNNASRASTGVFDVPHQIGHTDYIATVTVNSNEAFIGVIWTKNSNSIRIAIKGLDDGFWNYGFDIIIVGRNMV